MSSLVGALRITSVMAMFVAGCGGLVQDESGVAAHDDAPSGSVDAGPSLGDASADGTKTPLPPAQASPPVTLRCFFSDGPFLIPTQQVASAIDLVIRLENAELGVYVSNGNELRRYRLATESPCALDRDLAFGTSGKVPARGGFTLDQSGNVWSSSLARVARVFPTPTRRCTLDPAYKDDEGNVLYEPGPLYLEEGDKTGWTLGGPPGKLGRFTDGTDACSVTLVDSPFAFSLRSNTPRDALGRLHVIDGPSPGMVGVYTTAGAAVGSYFAKSTPNDPDAIDVTRCAGGVCVLGSSAAGYSLTYATDDGAPRGVLPTIKGLEPRRIAADRLGPVFFAGASNSSLEADYQVVVQIAGPPP